MTIDPDNPIVKLCAQGMQAEAERRHDDAAAFFNRAWQESGDDFEACIAAHYVARHQPTQTDTLHWNRVALERADLVGDARVDAFYPSLHLNMGRSYEDVGDLDAARRHYAMAEERLGVLGDSPYAEIVRGGVAAALARVNAGAT